MGFYCPSKNKSCKFQNLGDKRLVNSCKMALHPMKCCTKFGFPKQNFTQFHLTDEISHEPFLLYLNQNAMQNFACLHEISIWEQQLPSIFIEVLPEISFLQNTITQLKQIVEIHSNYFCTVLFNLLNTGQMFQSLDYKNP